MLTVCCYGGNLLNETSKRLMVKTSSLTSWLWSSQPHCTVFISRLLRLCDYGWTLCNTLRWTFSWVVRLLFQKSRRGQSATKRRRCLSESFPRTTFQLRQERRRPQTRFWQSPLSLPGSYKWLLMFAFSSAGHSCLGVWQARLEFSHPVCADSFCY